MTIYSYNLKSLNALTIFRDREEKAMYIRGKKNKVRKSVKKTKTKRDRW